MPQLSVDSVHVKGALAICLTLFELSSLISNAYPTMIVPFQRHGVLLFILSIREPVSFLMQSPGFMSCLRIIEVFCFGIQCTNLQLLNFFRQLILLLLQFVQLVLGIFSDWLYWFFSLSSIFVDFLFHFIFLLQTLLKVLWNFIIFFFHFLLLFLAFRYYLLQVFNLTISFYLLSPVGTYFL